MGEFSIWHWLVVLLVVMLLFGSGKVSSLMGDLAKGIKTFKATMAEDDGSKAKPQPAPPPVAAPVPGSLEAQRTAERPPAVPAEVAQARSAPTETAPTAGQDTSRAA